MRTPTVPPRRTSSAWRLTIGDDATTGEPVVLEIRRVDGRPLRLAADDDAPCRRGCACCCPMDSCRRHSWAERASESWAESSSRSWSVGTSATTDATTRSTPRNDDEGATR